ncbi:TetR family transcriptional regulator [Streptomyces sp. H39-S7]|uniref:TetR family transcriptional regulator n=1 Tax=Streptomyces sp. H39-S7 TaxID=3004357 RepID=UPI0022AFA872|nr:TetR family transcriptional regulator [Streptomyces sp. H39-S7]MCZ4122321.1 TetR family transcriptional regulator [Streptomyces sp. H39-S7]
MAYDSAATRARLLDAAYDEFVERGLAGARVNRIADAAESNKQGIYAYFGPKDAFFDAVLNSRLQALADLVPFEIDDLPGYVGSLFDYFVAHPGILRLAQWRALERPEPSPVMVDTHVGKAQELATAHGAQLEVATDVMMLILALAQVWNTTAVPIRTPGGAETAERLERHRASVVRAATAIAREPLG